MYAADLDFYKDLPEPPSQGFEVARIKGNLSDEAKQLSANAIWWYNTGDSRAPTLLIHEGSVFASGIARQMRITEMEAYPHSVFSQSRAKVAFEMEIDKQSMCNVYGVMHGGASGFLLDICAGALMVTLHVASEVDCMGPSQDVSLQWLRPGQGGKTIIVTSEITKIDGRELTIDGKIMDKESGKVLAKSTEKVVAVNLQAPKL